MHEGDMLEVNKKIRLLKPGCVQIYYDFWNQFLTLLLVKTVTNFTIKGGDCEFRNLNIK